MTTHARTERPSIGPNPPAQPPTAEAAGTAGSTSSREPTPFLCRRPVRLTIYALLVAFLLLMLGWGIIPRLLDPTFEQHIQEKRVLVGMTREQVLQAWGSPYQTNVTYTKDGTRREEWVFEDWIDAGHVKHRYLYFEEGILVGGWR